MYKSEYYYGLPQEIWDNLILKAEDLLRDEDLGSHIVGIYPSYERVYGLESCSPGIVCLYIDSVDSLLDPFRKHVEKNTTYFIGESRSRIEMIDLFDWAADIYNVRWWEHLALLHGDIAHQEESLSGIIDAANLYVQEAWIGSLLKRINPYMLKPDFFKTITDITNISLCMRTAYVLDKTNRYCPSIDKEWGEVVLLDSIPCLFEQKMTEVDEIFKKRVIDNDVLSKEELEELKIFMSWVHGELHNYTEDTSKLAKLLTNFRNEVIKFYRFQL